MTLLITGGCGFIGSNFINYFAKKYPNVKIVNIDALYYCANVNNVEKEIRESDRYIFINGNIRSYDLVKYVMETYKCTDLIHFAAQSHVQSSFNEPLTYTKDNILGTHVLLECARKYGKFNRIIHISTDEVYGESMLGEDIVGKTEECVLCPTNPYAATKASAELIIQSYYHSYKMPIIICRGNNVYGPNQYPEKLIPKFINMLKEDKKVTIQGDGLALRSFMYVTDTISGVESVLLKGKIGEIYNIGCDPGMEHSVIDIAKILIKLIKGTEDYEQYIEYIEDRPFNDKRYFIDNSKLKKLGWKININLLEGINKII